MSGFDDTLFTKRENCEGAWIRGDIEAVRFQCEVPYCFGTDYKAAEFVGGVVFKKFVFNNARVWLVWFGHIELL